MNNFSIAAILGSGNETRDRDSSLTNLEERATKTDGDDSSDEEISDCDIERDDSGKILLFIYKFLLLLYPHMMISENIQKAGT